MLPNQVYIELLTDDFGWKSGMVVKAEKEGRGVAFEWNLFRVGLSAEAGHYRELTPEETARVEQEETKEIPKVDVRIETPPCEAC